MSQSGFKGPSHFITTSWTLLGKIGVGDDGNNAFDTICERYQKPLWIYLRRLGVRQDQAQDLVQDFFTHALGEGLFSRPAEAEGRFRNWLLTSFRRFCKDKARLRQVQFEQNNVRLSGNDEGVPLFAEPADFYTAEEAFERQWAWDLLSCTYRDVETLSHARRERWKFEIFQLKCESERRGERPTWRQWGKEVGRPDKSKDQLAYAYLQVQEEASRIFAQYVAHEFPGEDPAELRREVQHVWEIILHGPPEEATGI